jgi:hypothetical protein
VAQFYSVAIHGVAEEVHWSYADLQAKGWHVETQVGSR